MRYRRITLNDEDSKFSLPVYTECGKDLLLHAAFTYQCEKLYKPWLRTRRLSGSSRTIINSIFTCYVFSRNDWLSAPDGSMSWDPESRYCQSIKSMCQENYRCSECSAFEILGKPRILAAWLKDLLRVEIFDKSRRLHSKLLRDLEDMAGRSVSLLGYGSLFKLFSDFDAYSVRFFNKDGSIPEKGSYEYAQSILPIGVGRTGAWESRSTVFDFAKMPEKKSYPMKDLYFICELLLGKDPGALKKRYGQELFDKIVGSPKDVFSEEMRKIKSEKISSILAAFQENRAALECESKDIIDKFIRKERALLKERITQLEVKRDEEIKLVQQSGVAEI